MNDEKIIRYEPDPQPEMRETIEIKFDTSEFSEPERAEALIRNLNLSSKDKLVEESNGESYIVNPRWVLKGTKPRVHKDDVENLKKLLTPAEIKAVHKEILKKPKTYDEVNHALYNKIVKRTDKYFKDEEIREELKDELKNILYSFKNEGSAGINNTLYHLLETGGNEDYKRCYREAWFNRPIPDLREWREENDGEYDVLTDSEADERADDYLDEDQWKMAVESGNTTSGYDDWVEDVKKFDGRGSIINGYNGTEDEETIDGTTYYIYRTN
jgi:hypothetical protein